MSNIRPIGDPSLATAMLATFQSIDNARTAPSGISEPRWRILQCIAKAVPNVPSPGELRMCSGLNKAALAEHVQALQWKGLLEMNGYRLSPSAAAMVGIEQPYPPKDAKTMVLVAEPGPRPDDAVVALQHAIAAMGVKDMPILPAEALAPVFIGVDIATGLDISIEARVTVGADGKIAKIEPLAPMDPADVPACMRPDCTLPVEPIPASCPPRKASEHGRGGAAVAHPIQGDVHRDRVAPDRALRTPEEVAGSNPVPGQPAELTPELVTQLRAAIPPRDPIQQQTSLIWPVATSGGGNSDGWEAQARNGSEELLRALRRHHPERCGGR